jgi:hypothetical protein
MLLSVKVKMAVVGLVVAGGAAAALALGPAGLAVGQSSPPTVGQSSQPVQVQVAVNSSAMLVAGGAGVDVSIKVTCSGPVATSWNVSVNLTEKVGADLATGSSFGVSGGSTFAGSTACTGSAQNAVGLVIANPGGKAFVNGSATAQVSVTACETNASNGACGSQFVQPTIKIRG